MKKDGILANLIEALKAPKSITYNVYITDKHDFPTFDINGDVDDPYDYFKPF